MTHHPASPAIPALTGIRGYAAYWVFLSHLCYSDALLLPLGLRAKWQRCSGLIMHEYLAVDIFFMLSGFVLSHVHRHEFQDTVRRPEYGRFLLLRLARVYPLHALALAVVFSTVRYLPDPVATNTTPTLILQLTLMASWGIGPPLSWNLPAWSLSSEWLAYLLFPLVSLSIGALKSARAQIFALAALVGLFYSMMFGQPFPLNYSSGPGAHTRVLTGVAIGVLMRALYDNPRIRSLPWSYVLYASLPIAALAMSELSGARRPDNIWCYTMMVVILLAAACGKGKLMAPLTGRIARYLGDISYAVYIFHYPVMRVLRSAFEPELLRIAHTGSDAQVWTVLCGTIAVATLVAAVAHQVVETPFRRWAKRRITGERAPALVSVVASPST